MAIPVLSKCSADTLLHTGDIEDSGTCFIIRDSNGQALTYVYYENEPGRRTAVSLRGAPHRHQYRQAAGAAAALVRYSALIRIDVPSTIVNKIQDEA